MTISLSQALQEQQQQLAQAGEGRPGIPAGDIDGWLDRMAGDPTEWSPYAEDPYQCRYTLRAKDGAGRPEGDCTDDYEVRDRWDGGVAGWAECGARGTLGPRWRGGLFGGRTVEAGTAQALADALEAQVG